MLQPIRVRAKPGVLVPVPGQNCAHGGVAMYVARDIDHEAHKRGETDPDVLYPPKKDPVEYTQKQHGFTVLSEIYRAHNEGALLRELKTPAPAALPDSDKPSGKKA